MKNLKFRPLNELIEKDNHPLVKDFRQFLMRYDTGLLEDFSRVLLLSEQDQDKVLDELLEYTCETGNILNIELGRAGLLALPRQWLIKNLEQAVVRKKLLSDDWAYRRLLEVTWKLDLDLTKKFTEWGLESNDPHILDVAKDSQDDFENCS